MVKRLKGKKTKEKRRETNTFDGYVESAWVSVKIEFVDTSRHGCWKLVPHANDLAIVRDTWAVGPHNRSPFIFRVARAFVASTERPKLVLRSTPKRYQVQAGKVTVPLSRVPGSPGSRQTGSRLIYRRRFRYSAVSTIFSLPPSLPLSLPLYRFLRNITSMYLVLVMIFHFEPESRIDFSRFFDRLVV